MRPVYALLALLLFAVPASPALAYSVSGGKIVDERGHTVQLKGLNWFGFETDTLAPHGLWARNWKEQLDQMQALGVNALRVPLCPAAIRGGPTKGVDAKLNPDLAGLDSAQLLDHFVRELDRRGMYVLLDHHRPNCESQSELWYADGYSEADWTADLVTLAERFRDVPHVIGLDLKNEPRGKASWGTGEAATDWNAAAERAGKAVIAKAPQWLLFVQGIEKNPKCSSEGPHFWGENLEPFACTPLDIPPDRLVLAPHTYGPDVFKQPFFDDPTFPANMPAIWERNFGQFLRQGYAVILGEFGGRYGEGGDARDRVWQDMLVQYLVERRVRSAFYWSWNPNSKDTGGLLQDDWKTVSPGKLALLQRLWSGAGNPAPRVAAVAAPPATVGAVVSQTSRSRKPPEPAAPGSARFTVSVLSDWRAGYCADVEVRGAAGPAPWSIRIPLAGRVSQSWNVQLAADGAFAVARGVDWNARVSADAPTHFGFCAIREAAGAAPSLAAASAADSAGIESRTVIDSEWATGYCARVIVRNGGTAATHWTVTVPLRGTVQNHWKARIETRKGEIFAQGEDYNAQLAPGAETDFGFCAAK